MSELKKKLLAMGVQTVPVSALAQPLLSPLDEQSETLLPRLARLDDDQLLEIATHAQRLGSCAFRLRGACVVELRRRTIRLAGGRGNRDTERVGVKARLIDVAVRLGVSVSTLKTDARIYEIFFTGETGLAREPTLPRDYYVTALGSPDPLGVIYTAYERRSDPTYNREQFRRDVQAMRATTSSDEPLLPGIPTLPSTVTRVRILPDAQPAQTALTERHGRSPAEIVAAALIAYHAAMTATPTRRRRSTAKTMRRLTQQPLPLS